MSGPCVLFLFDCHVSGHPRSIPKQLVNLGGGETAEGVRTAASKSGASFSCTIADFDLLFSIHMNATRWPSLTEFAKHLGREGLCRVEDTDKGIQIAWIDNSPEALRRQDAIRKKERQDKGDEEREQKMIREQIARAEMDAEMKAQQDDDDEAREYRPNQGEKIKLSFGAKAKESKDPSPPVVAKLENDDRTEPEMETSKSVSPPTGVPTPPPEKISLKMDMNSKPKNVFAGIVKKNALGAKAAAKEVPRKPVSEAERIMKEEIERKRIKDESRPGLNPKRPRLA